MPISQGTTYIYYVVASTADSLAYAALDDSKAATSNLVLQGSTKAKGEVQMGESLRTKRSSFQPCKAIGKRGRGERGCEMEQKMLVGSMVCSPPQSYVEAAFESVHMNLVAKTAFCCVAA